MKNVEPQNRDHWSFIFYLRRICLWVEQKLKNTNIKGINITLRNWCFLSKVYVWERGFSKHYKKWLGAYSWNVSLKYRLNNNFVFILKILVKVCFTSIVFSNISDISNSHLQQLNLLTVLKEILKCEDPKSAIKILICASTSTSAQACTLSTLCIEGSNGNRKQILLSFPFAKFQKREKKETHWNRMVSITQALLSL